MYDNSGNLSSINSDYEYSILDELSTNNPNIKVCADVSLYWMFDVIINTSKSLLYKHGITKTLNILDDDNQVFNNMHHIEDGQFVDHCTRKSKLVLNTNTSNIDTLNQSNKIILSSYAEVIVVGNSKKIDIINIPSGYSKQDIKYTSFDPEIATVSNGSIYANKYGTTKILVSTNDDKYSAYINVLVSTG